MKGSDKAVQQIVQPFIEQYGLEVTRTKRHWKVKNPKTGRLVTLSVSPSDNRAMLNMRSDLRRLCQQGETK